MDKDVIQAAFEKYGSDKAEHGYAEVYSMLYRPFHDIKFPKRILEIGVKQGASIRAWKELFPEAEIHGLDLFEEFPKPDIEGVTFHKGSQCDWRILERLRDIKFDLIIDDGSHNARDQWITFFGLVGYGMTYVIEDTHCNDDEFYRQGLPFPLTMSLFLPREAYASFVVNTESGSRMNFINIFENADQHS